MKERAWANIVRIGLTLAIGVALLLAHKGVDAQPINRAVLVVQYGEGAVSTYCIEFAEPEITGLDVLLRSGLDVVYSAGGLGAMVCKIGDRGCHRPGNCLCECKGADCVYWSYWHQVDGVWQYSNRGASSYIVQPGAVEGWVWGKGSINDAPRPPLVRFEDICRSETPTPLPTYTLVSTDTPVPTDTLLPTATHTSTPAPSTIVVSPTSTLALPTPTHTALTAPTATRSSPAATPRTAALPTRTPVEVVTPVLVPSATPLPMVPVSPDLSNYAFFAVLVVVLAVIGLVVRKRL